MLKSESIKELANALCKAQSQMTSAPKDAKNPHFNSKYATLASALDAVRSPLASHGLSVVQTFSFDAPTSNMFLETTLMHTSGEFISSTLRLLLQRQDMQGLGSATSYARRYALMAITGIAQDDDDGNVAVQRETYQQIHVPVKELTPQAKKEFIVETQKEMEKAHQSLVKDLHKDHRPSIMDLAKFTITFGPNRGKQLQDIDPEALIHSIDKAKIWIGNNQKHGDLMSVVEFADTATKYLNYSATTKSADFNDPKKPLPNSVPEQST